MATQTIQSCDAKGCGQPIVEGAARVRIGVRVEVIPPIDDKGERTGGVIYGAELEVHESCAAPMREYFDSIGIAAPPAPPPAEAPAP